MKSLKKLNEDFHAETPPKWRRLGKSINLLGSMIQATVAGMQITGEVMSPKHYFVFVIVLVVLQWGGSTMTDFFTEEQTIKDIQNGQI